VHRRRRPHRQSTAPISTEVVQVGHRPRQAGRTTSFHEAPPPGRRPRKRQVRLVQLAMTAASADSHEPSRPQGRRRNTVRVALVASVRTALTNPAQNSDLRRIETRRRRPAVFSSVAAVVVPTVTALPNPCAVGGLEDAPTCARELRLLVGAADCLLARFLDPLEVPPMRPTSSDGVVETIAETVGKDGVVHFQAAALSLGARHSTTHNSTRCTSGPGLAGRSGRSRTTRHMSDRLPKPRALQSAARVVD